MIVRRHYGIIADPNAAPRSGLHLRAFDSAARSDYNYVLRERRAQNLQTGIRAMRRLTSGKVLLECAPMPGSRMSMLEHVERSIRSPRQTSRETTSACQILHHIESDQQGGNWMRTVNIRDRSIVGRLLFNEGASAGEDHRVAGSRPSVRATSASCRRLIWSRSRRQHVDLLSRRANSKSPIISGQRTPPARSPATVILTFYATS